VTDPKYHKFRRQLRRRASDNDFAARYWQRWLELEEQGKEPGAIYATVCEEFRADFDRMKSVIKAAQVAMSKSIGESTGMTLDDYVWLRDYDPPEEQP
jgi:hypothetical protein